MERIGYFQFLRTIYFFKDLDDTDIRDIMAYCHETNFSAGEVVFWENDEADRFYIIMSGEVEVWKGYGSDQADMLAVHGPGHLFGEMALVDELPRSATVKSRGNTRVLYIGQDEFQKILQEKPTVAFAIVKSLSAMVRKSNDTFLEDLRERNKRLEIANRDLQTAQSELLKNERLSTLGKFSSMILHDIRNPISVVKAYTDLLLISEGIPQKNMDYIRNIRFEAERLNQLANELLDYSRGEIRLDMGSVDLDGFFLRLEEWVRRRFASRRCEIVLRNGHQGPVIFDQERMFRALTNLSDNARKAMTMGGSFSLTAEDDDGWLLFTVSDTGEGMSKEVLERVFEPFYSSAKGGGTGLGMAIVKSTVEAHGGNIEIDSAPGKGTRIFLRIPLHG
ncbi:ATP-binding protein [Sediminispirochaeta bajacaliforniensis]|uniref:ATP-binding protein n=1 Tax=Sediminispirochaeta bajacaliforniensis TaxID=148 RepID=UPI00036E9B18|nr:ATP-binding protein [Sediminispirochaeta bajacaliforniensis]